MKYSIAECRRKFFLRGPMIPQDAEEFVDEVRIAILDLCDAVERLKAENEKLKEDALAVCANCDGLEEGSEMTSKNEQSIREMWDIQADQFNKWANLGLDEIELFADEIIGNLCADNERLKRYNEKLKLADKATGKHIIRISELEDEAKSLRHKLQRAQWVARQACCELSTQDMYAHLDGDDSKIINALYLKADHKVAKQ